MGKSVGPDQVSWELIQAIASNQDGEDALLSWYNDILATQKIPDNWHRSLMTLLPFQGML